MQKLNADIENFCHQNGYKFIWFCRDVEEVFLHKTVEDSKKKEAPWQERRVICCLC